MILILTRKKDSHADRIINLLERRGRTSIRFDPAEFPRSATLSVSYAPNNSRTQILSFNSIEVDMTAVTAVWYRRPGLPVPDARLPDEVAGRYVAQECGMVLQDLWSTSVAAWLPGHPAAVRRAEHKGLQLQIAGELGFELPPTLITNSPQAALDFYRSHDGLIVSKQAGTAFSSTIGLGMIRYTELVTKRDIMHCQAIAHCPVIFQAYVQKRLELRVTIVGERVFSAEIHSQTANHTRYDWRRYNLAQTPHLPHSLPCEIETRCIALIKRLGLHYGAIDMIVTPDDRYVFLEINPNGQYLWIEDHTGLPISEAICDFLTCEPAPRRMYSDNKTENCRA